MSDIPFSDEEKLSILRVLLDIARSDNDIDLNEAAYFTQICVTLGFEPDNVDSILRTVNGRSVAASLYCLGQMSPDKKAATTVMVNEMVKADGVVEQEEVNVATAVLAAMFA